MWKIFLFIILFVSSLLKAQNKELENKWAASLTGDIIPVPGKNFGIQPGVEYMFNHRLSLLMEITLLTPLKNVSDPNYLNRKYFRIQPQVRFRFSEKKSIRQYYIGLRGSYASRKFTWLNTGFYYYDLPGDSIYRFDKANANSPISTISFQLGSIMSGKRKFFADMYIGFGMRFINTKYNEIENLRKGIRSRPADCCQGTSSYSYLGKITRFHFNTGVRLMYRLGKIGKLLTK
jgi:hypothetical protein